MHAIVRSSSGPDGPSQPMPARARARTRFMGLAASLCAALTLLAPGAATAQVDNPPLLPQEVIVFPERDFASISGFQPDADLLVQVRRGGTVVSDAVGRTDATGLLEVNHPGGVCWRQLTPDIVAGDVVRVTYRSTAHNAALVPAPVGGSGAATDTQNVTAAQAYDAGDGTVVVKGRARLANGSRIPLGRLEVRIINDAFRDPPSSRIDRRDIRADSAGGRVDGVPGATGTLAYDGVDLDTFTAVFTGLNEFERRLAVEGQTRIMAWQQTTAAGDRLGLTIYEVGEIGGPGFGGCPAGEAGTVAPQPPTAPVPYDPAALKDAALPVNQSALKDVVVFPKRDFVSIEGFAAGSDLQVVVRRPDVGIIGTARGIVGAGGLFEVNHPGGVCWAGQTPDIAAGDLVDVFQVAGGSFHAGQTQRVIDATIDRTAFITAAGDVRVNGAARNADGTPFDLASLEQRMVNPDFVDSRIGRRDISADVNGGRVGNIADARGRLQSTAVAGEWRATYTGLTPAEQQLVLAGQNRVLAWLSTNANGDRFGTTIFEADEIDGPGFGGCPPTGNAAIPVPAPLARLDVALAMAGPAQVASGADALYTLTVTNTGSLSIPQVVVTDVLPASGFVSASVVASSGECTASGTTTTCNLGAMAAGASATVTVTLTGVTGTVTHSASVSPRDASGASLTDADTSDNSRSVTTTLTAPPAPVGTDVEVKGSASNGQPVVNTAFTYTWQIRNNGKEAADSVTFTDALPASLRIQQVSATGGAVCNASPAGTSGGSVTCTSRSLGAGQSFNVTVGALATVRGTIANTGRVSFAGTDTRTSNDAATVTVTTR